jgi:hypothetical protein
MDFEESESKTQVKRVPSNEDIPKQGRKINLSMNLKQQAF